MRKNSGRKRCLRCGKCCTDKENIGWVTIHQSDIKRWKGKGIFGKIKPSLSTTSELAPETGYIIDFSSSGRCPLSTKANSMAACYIHHFFGYQMKPSECRQFPRKSDWNFCPMLRRS